MQKLFWTAVITLFIACSSDSGGGEKQRDGSVKLSLGKLQVPLFDSVSVHVSADDMQTVRISANSVSENIKIDGIPLGESRKFEVKVYADQGKEVLRGEATADITGSQIATIPIVLIPISGFLRLEIPLGLPNNTDIRSGTLRLGSLVFQMQFESGKGVFSTGALPLNQTFDLYLELKDSNGEVLFFGEKQIKLSSILQTETIQLQSTKGSVNLELEMSYEGPIQILVMLPISISRKPMNYGDLFFTEIFADPKTNGDDFEYMEIYNATLDTLELSDCRVARSRSTATTAVTQRLDMPPGLILPPMEFLFFGRDSVEGAHFNYGRFTLVKTAQSLGFFCNNWVIDSLYYSKTGENPFPVKQGTAMQLPLANFAEREIGTSWCLGFSPKQDANCQ
ncbi:MAG: hypothetical protein LBU89_00560 [Fibromonadaceae bacterium]|jgi:hypothetical protein|nr:hypothetical protein [Fibromonadaceae bacterium]